MNKKCFTLAEVLIVIGVIGIVAAITLPGLTTKLKKKVEDYQKTVIEAKIVQGLNMLSSQENGLNVNYNNTEEFVLALSKYLKMSTICGKDNLKNCFAYEKINYDKSNETKQQEIDKITTAKNLKLSNENGNEYLDPAGFVLADGTPFIISWNNNCGKLADDKGRMLVDPDKALKSIPTGCIDGIYDRNGTRSPNKFGKDVQPLFAAKIGSSCVAEIGGVCIGTAPQETTPLAVSEYCENGVVKPEYQQIGISNCFNYGTNDSWAGAMKTCANQGMHLATKDDFDKIVEECYITKEIPDLHHGSTIGKAFNESKCADLQSIIGHDCWAKEEKDTYSSYAFSFNQYGVEYYYSNQHAQTRGSDKKTLCIADE